MKPSDQCAQLVAFYEDKSNEAYPDPATGGEPWTIGYGHTGAEVKPGLVWTDEQCSQALAADLARFGADVTELLAGHVVEQYQFDALVSFAFNVGSDIDLDKIAEGLGDSTLLRLVLAGNMHNASNEFLKWINANGKPMLGLKRRRMSERAMFLGQPAAEAIRIGQLIK